MQEESWYYFVKVCWCNGSKDDYQRSHEGFYITHSNGAYYGKHNFENRLFFADNGKWLHQSCEKMS